LLRLHKSINTVEGKIKDPYVLMSSLFTHQYPANSLERTKLLREQFMSNLNGLTDIPVEYIDELGNVTEARIPTIGYGRKML
jgi:hypothetical protein